MGILRTNEISGLETPTPVTGSVSFDGNGDYLIVNAQTLNSNQWTLECWIYPTNLTGNKWLFSQYAVGDANRTSLYIDDGILLVFNGSQGSTIGNSVLSTNTWFHLAFVRDGSTLTAYLNGVQEFQKTNFAGPYQSNTYIGSYDGSSGNDNFQGYISNVRVVNSILYSSNFTPPVHELQPIGDTVLLCCNNPDSAGAEATGKTITINGDAAASTFSPGLTRDFTYGTQFEGVAKFDTQGYFVPPSGTTEQRSRGRGIFGGAYTTPGGADKSIETISLQSGGIAQDFGDMSSTAMMATALGNQTRAVLAGGYSAPAPVDTIEFVEFATQGNAVNFGTLSGIRRHMASVASSTKGVWSGGTTTGSTNCITTMDNVTIAAKGTAVDYGDLSAARRSHAGGASPTRGVFAGGNTNTPTQNLAMQTIDYFTIASGGTALSFGTLTVGTREIGGSSDSTRAVFGGGFTSAITNTIEYVTIATTGNAQDFGDLYVTRSYANGCSSSIRAIFAGGVISPLYSNVIDKVTIQSTGNATDFGDLIQQRLGYANACSDSHGGLS